MILIIGYGSTLRGDDGVGQHIAWRLEAGEYGEAVEVLACHQLIPELVESIRRADLVVFVDATEEGQPGDIHCTAIQPETVTGAFTHNVTPMTLLAIANDWYGVQPKGIAVSITGAQFDYSEELSPQVQAVIPKVVEMVQQLFEARQSGIIDIEGE
jgi:hydrogenase maturation protease